MFELIGDVLAADVDVRENPPNGRSAAMPAVPAALNSRAASRLHRSATTALWNLYSTRSFSGGISPRAA